MAFCTYSFRPTEEAHAFFKISPPAASSDVETVKTASAEQTRLKPAPVQPQEQPPTPIEPVVEPTPAPVVCAEDQWVRADGGGCLDKPVEPVVQAAPAAVAVAAVKPHVPVTYSGGGSGSCDLASNYSWPSRTARAICMAESGGRPGAVGDTSTAYPSCGLMQIRTLPGRPSCEQLKDGGFNMDYAYNMWKGQGFSPWSAYTNGAYLRYY